jgi:1-deoxy-D-xylulose-5-phosphate synthase
MIVCCGTQLGASVKAAALLRDEGLDVGVINARFIKPLDTETILKAVESSPFVLTVEEGQLMTGFGSAVLEAANNVGLRTAHIRRLGLPDRFVEHGERGELLADLGLDATGIARACREMNRREQIVGQSPDHMSPDGETAAALPATKAHRGR